MTEREIALLKLKKIRKSISLQRTEVARILENILLSELIADRLKELLDNEILKNK